MTTEETCREIDAWLINWLEDPLNAKSAFIQYYTWLKENNMTLAFNDRPGISYSLRASHHEHATRPLFVLVDIVDDVPSERWLSVCFYNDMVQDPDELGDFVPNGLMNEDALCLNLDEENDEMRAYIQKRIEEAAKSAQDSM